MEAKENYSGNFTNEIIIIRFYKAGLGSHSLTMEDTALNRTELTVMFQLLHIKLYLF